MRSAFNPLGVEMVGNKNFTGMITAGINSEAPEGWLICNGASYQTSEYSDLFNIIGYNFGGSGDTFNVPDYRGLLLQMVSTNQVIGTKIEAGLPNITGILMQDGIENYSEPNGIIYSAAGAFEIITQNTQTNATYTGTDILRYSNWVDLNASRSSPIYGKSETVQPPVSLVNYFIKY